MSSSPEKSVLIVDESEDSREVLRTILSQRGVRIFEACEERSGLQIARDEHPNVIVFDVDTTAGDFSLCDEIAEQADIDKSSVVLLGSISRWQGESPREVVRKPYHYGPLIRKIEALLAEADAMPAAPKAA